jgi:molybdopterin/thiamine biosynthesis adenylyltransferase
MNSKQNIQSYGRFKTLPWFNSIAQSRIMVFGQGGIGSWLTFLLARTGANLFTIDDDTVEDSNLAGQLYGASSIKKKKVQAMKEIVAAMCGENNITAIDEKVILASEGSQWRAYISMCDVVCVSFDSIAARRLVYNVWKLEGKENSLFVDGRMSAEQGQIFTLEKKAEVEAVQFYEDSFFDDSILPEAPCTAKATSHCGALISSLMVSQITNWFTNQTPGTMQRVLTSQLDFYLPVNLFQTNELSVCT